MNASARAEAAARQGEWAVRPAVATDRGALGRVARRAFAPGFWPFLLPMLSKDTLVATDAAGRIAGGAVLRTFRVGAERFGVVYWIFSDPEVQGAGAGKALLDAALEWMRRRGCSRAVASVDGYNSRSWNLFHGRGFRFWPACRQWAQLGRSWPALWWGSFHLLDVGNFLLERKLANGPCLAADAHARGPLAVSTVDAGYAVAGTVLPFWLVLWLRGLPGVEALGDMSLAGPAYALAAAVVATAYLVAGLAAQAAAAGPGGRRPFLFRAWDTGPLLATLVAVAFGGFLPAPGGWYDGASATPRYTTPQARELLGRMGLAGAAITLFLWAVSILGRQSGTSLWSLLGRLGTVAGPGFALFYVLLFFPPFQAMPAAHLARWKPGAWALMVVAAIALAWVA
ncbi:GNAT family N-acetyltransferase [Carboxydochorda subterranea]|uniref:GNAT family N-acetyltransferase n=1 Tax=Carboxydichorda subterranea TaxID=3109565 RepID=A0ABZ1BYT2_9FIRM|nr:GNAT family N-acetyltransferase [Limnochorda sp. L945t]WRP17927.1 GNAT family N-acetyltransferase [Limnochorda sp. L945t]